MIGNLEGSEAHERNSTCSGGVMANAIRNLVGQVVEEAIASSLFY
jgi:hypothetical protein